MLWRKAKNADKKGEARNFFATPEDVSGTPWKESWNHPWLYILKPSFIYSTTYLFTEMVWNYDKLKKLGKEIESEEPHHLVSV